MAASVATPPTINPPKFTAPSAFASFDKAETSGSAGVSPVGGSVATEGDEVDPTVGTRVRATEGEAVGATVRKAVGACVGETVGIDVAVEGAAVGRSVVGLPLGDEEGNSEIGCVKTITLWLTPWLQWIPSPILHMKNISFPDEAPSDSWNVYCADPR
jgi:hypothetical protein